MSDQPLQHDPSKFIMVGSANRSVYFCLVRSDAPVKTFAETFDREVIIGTSGEGATLREMPVMLVNVLGVKLRLVGGYTGSRDIIMAMERNEVHGGCVSYDTVARDAMFRDKRSHVLFQAALESDSRIPDVPLVTNLAQADEAFAVRPKMGISPARESSQAAYFARLPL
jgi:tripartite-type tricarboxylate transporter receptor subunit TctC